MRDRRPRSFILAPDAPPSVTPAAVVAAAGVLAVDGPRLERVRLLERLFGADALNDRGRALLAAETTLRAATGTGPTG